MQATVVDESPPRTPPIIQATRVPETEGSTGNRCFAYFAMDEEDSKSDFKPSLSSVDFPSPELGFVTCSLPTIEEDWKGMEEWSAGFLGIREPLDGAANSCSGGSIAIPSGINPVELLDPPLIDHEMLMHVGYSNNPGGQKIKPEGLPDGWDAGSLEHVFYEDAAENLDEALEDGYKWRKYGQKHVKGSEYPRSYYRCTHPGCEVKKKVERSYDGYITEIIYNGEHCHHMPQPDHRSMVGLPISQNKVTKKIEGFEMGCMNATDLSNPLAATLQKHQDAGDFEGKNGNILALIKQEREEGSTRTSPLILDDDDENEFYLNKRTEAFAYESRLSSRNANEQKVVIQVKSTIDILDDGYRWRKYGQKVVKGNPNPRSYYKCTSPGCSVKKHVERAAQDLESVVTSYEGKHCHEVPSSRSSQNRIAYGTNSQIVPNFGIDNAIAHTPSSMLKNEKLDSYVLPDFQTIFNAHEGHMHSGFIADTIITYPFFPTKFDPMVQLAIDSYGLNSNCTNYFRQVPSMFNVLAEYRTSLPMELRGSHNLALSGLDNVHGAPIDFDIESLPLQQQQQSGNTDIRFLEPLIQEQSDSAVYDSSFTENHHLADIPSTTYGQVSGGFAFKE